MSVFLLRTELTRLTCLPSTVEILADNPPQCCPDLSLCFVGSAFASCESIPQSGTVVEEPGRELISVELQRQGHYTNKEGGMTRLLDWELRLLGFCVYFLSAMTQKSVKLLLLASFFSVYKIELQLLNP